MSKVEEFLKAGNLVPTKVLVHPKSGHDYYRTAMVRPQEMQNKKQKSVASVGNRPQQSLRSASSHGLSLHGAAFAGKTSPTKEEAEVGEVLRIHIGKALTDGNHIYLVNPEVISKTPAQVTSIRELARMYKEKGAAKHEDVALDEDSLVTFLGEAIIEKGRVAFHEHDAYPEHPVAVKFHNRYFAMHTASSSAGEDSRKESSDKYQHIVPEAVLRSNITSEEDHSIGINKTLFVDIEGDGKGVFKPKSGTSAWAEADNPNSQMNNEAAAYLLARFFDLDIVPTTIIREHKGDIGSMQKFIEDAAVGSDTPQYSIDKISDDDVIDMALFDMLIGNSDRHGGNWMVRRSDNKLFAIDHGFAFQPGKTLVSGKFSYLSATRKLRIPERWRKKLEQLAGMTNKEIDALLSNLILSPSRNAMVSRMWKLNDKPQDWVIGT